MDGHPRDIEHSANRHGVRSRSAAKAHKGPPTYVSVMHKYMTGHFKVFKIGYLPIPRWGSIIVPPCSTGFPANFCRAKFTEHDTGPPSSAGTNMIEAQTGMRYDRGSSFMALFCCGCKFSNLQAKSFAVETWGRGLETPSRQGCVTDCLSLF